MIVKLFDIENQVVIPTIHCDTLKSLRTIKDNFPDNFMKVYAYIFYMTCPDPEINPFFNMTELDKEELILKEVKADFSTDDTDIIDAIKFCNSLYDTPTKRAYQGFKIMMDKLASFFESQALTTGRDGSLTAMVSAAEKYQKLRESFKGVEKDYNEEIQAETRGQQFTAYDQR